MQLIEKDKKIKELTKMVHMYETGQIKGLKGINKSPKQPIQEVMVINGSSPTKAADANEEEELMNKYDKDIYKMSRADFLMS